MFSNGMTRKDFLAATFAAGITSVSGRAQPALAQSSEPPPSGLAVGSALGFFVRHARNLEFSNIEIVTAKPDDRPAFWMHDVQGVDLFRVKAGRNAAAYSLRNVKDVRSFGSRDFRDRTEDAISRLDF